MGQRAAGLVEKLQRVVEDRRVALGGVYDGDQFGDVLAEQRRGEELFARGHPIDVAAQGVDLSVVSHVAERLGEPPGRERIGAEA